MRPNLLLVDADPRSLRVLEVSLRKAGYTVATCGDADDALELIRVNRPDLIVSDTQLPRTDGFALARKVREGDGGERMPFLFLSGDNSAESRVRALEVGVEDYLTKPAYIKEIVSRVETLLQRVTQQRVATEAGGKTRFRGTLSDTPLVDLLQSVQQGNRSGALHLSDAAQRATLYFHDGELQDAELSALRGEAAVFRALRWADGHYELDLRPVRRERSITRPTAVVLEEGMRRLDEWERLLEQLPDLDAVFEVNEAELLERLAEIPDAVNDVLRQVDGTRSASAVIDAAGGDDLSVLNTLSKLYFEGLLHQTKAGETRTLRPPATPSAAAPAVDAGVRQPVQAGSEARADGRARDAEDAAGPQPDSPENALDLAQPSLPPEVAPARASQLGTGRRRPSRRRKRLSMMTSPGMLSSSGSVAAPPPDTSAPDTSAPDTSAPDTSAPSTPAETSVEHARTPSRAPDQDSPAGAAADLQQGPQRAQDHPPAATVTAEQDTAEPVAAYALSEPAEEARPLTEHEEDDDDEEAWIAATLPPSVTRRKRVPAAVAAGVLVLLTVVAIRFSGDRDAGETERTAPATHTKVAAAAATEHDTGNEGAVAAQAVTAVPESPVEAPAAEEPTAEAPAAKEPAARDSAAEDSATEERAEEAPVLDPAAPGDAANSAATDVGDDTPDPAPPDAPPTVNEEALLEQVKAAAKLAARGRHRQAQALLTDLVEEAPDFAPALSQLGMAYLNVGKHGKAAEYATRAVTVDPTSSEGWIVLGAARHASRDYAGAREAYQQCVELGKGRYVLECRRMRR